MSPSLPERQTSAGLLERQTLAGLPEDIEMLDEMQRSDQ